MPRKTGYSRMTQPKAKLPKQKLKIPMPKTSVLVDAYRSSVTGSDSARISAFNEAVKWWDDAINYYLSKSPLDASQVKKYDTANKVRNQALSPSVTTGERLSFLERMLQLYEKIWASHNPPAIQPYLDKYNVQKQELEAKNAALLAKYQYITDSLNAAFSDVGVQFEVQQSETPRQFDGKNRIIISKQLAKELVSKSRKEGILPVLFSEATTVMKVAAIETDATGHSALNFQKYYQTAPQIMASMLKFCGTIERSKVFKAAPESLEATVATNSTAAKAPKAPRVPGATMPRPKTHSGPLVGGTFRPGSAMATLYDALSDQAAKATADVLKLLPVGSPMGRLKALVDIGQKNGRWTVVISGNTVQMTIH